ncbi:universal stress protein [Streptomyces sp. SCSIO 30461]|uniref:universal stress protein n=1 Tax=Streptomyces sp. SCSIO 30461 TaxID=3118085 RepID=UPI0030D0B926
MTAGGELPIVFGVDAAEPAGAAAAWAADEAVRRGASLKLVHAVVPVTHHVRGVEETAHHKALRQLGSEALDKAAVFAHARQPDLEVSVFMTDGNPAQVLVRQSEHARIVVLGSHRLGRLAEVLSARSAAVPVSANAVCPVVVVPDPINTPYRPARLVVGVDGSRSAAVALDHAFDAAARRGASVHAVWVWQPPFPAFIDESTALETCRRQLHEATAARSAAYRDVPFDHSVVRGHPVEALAGVSEHALAVVVGRRGREGFCGMRLGSVPHGLLHRASCPVITVPPRAGEEP